jgi:hypothetical protein
MVFYGHTISQIYAEPGVRLVDEQRFAYPVYAVFLMAPLVYANFADVQRWAPFGLSLITALNVFFCLDILRMRLRWDFFLAVVLFTLSSPQIVQALRFEQLALVDACFLTGAAWCVSRKKLTAAGVLLAFSTIKPQMALLPLCWFAVWSAGDLQKRWRLTAGFVGTLAMLIAAGEVLLPGWPKLFLAGLAAYRKYALPSSLLEMFLGDTLGKVLGGIVVVALLVFSVRKRKEVGNSLQFAYMLAVFFMGAIVVFPLFTPYNQVILILPGMLVLQRWQALPRMSRLIFLTLVSWPWIVFSVLLFFPPRLHSMLPLLPSLLVPFIPLIIPLLLVGRRSKADERLLLRDA